MARRKRRRHLANDAAGVGPAGGPPSGGPPGQRLAKTSADPAVGPSPGPEDRLKPWLLGGICALWVARPLLVSESAAEEGDGLAVVMLWLGLAAVWVLGLVGRKRFFFRFTRIDAAVLAVVALHMAAGIRGALVGHPRPAVNMIWEWVGLGMAFVLTRQVLDKACYLRAVAGVMIALAVGLAGFGVYQYAYELPATRAEYRRQPQKVLQEAGLDIAADPALRKKFEDRLNSPEPIATFALTNSLAGFLAPWLMVLVGIGIAGGTEGGRQSPAARRIGKLGMALSAALVAGCLILTMSRSAYLATGLGLVVLAGAALRSWRRRWPLAAGVGVVVVLAAAAVATGGVDASVFTQAGRSLAVRLHYWRATLAMIADHPWLGVGPGNFQAQYTRYKLPQAVEEVAEPHNFILEVWATAGTPAVIALAAVLGQLAGVMLAAAKRLTNGTDPCAAPVSPIANEQACTGRPFFALAGGLLGYPLGILAGWTTSAPPSVAGILLAMVLAAGAMAGLWPWVVHGRVPLWLPALALGVLLVNLLAAGGMGFPGVAGSLWLLVALGASLAENATRPGQAGAAPLEAQRAWPQPVAWALLAGALGAIVACYGTAYRPVLECRAVMEAARRQPELSESLLLRAARADPLSSRPWESLAALRFQTWSRHADATAAEAFKQATQAMLHRAPWASALWLATADRYLEVFLRTAQKKWLEESLEAYRQAAELYPANPIAQARWALACKTAGDEAGFRQHAGEALRLDALADPAGPRLPDELRIAVQRSNSEGG